VLALLLGGLAGCSSDPEPDVVEPTSEAPSTSTTEPISDPPTSEPTSEAPAESAQEFIRRWHEVSDAMQLSGETNDYLAMGPACKPCAATAQVVERYYEAGGFIRFSGTQVSRISKLGNVGGSSEFDVARVTAPTEYKEASSGPLMTFPGGESTLRMRLKPMGDSWLVLDYSQLAS
ncbi:MAG: hypothetical protein JWN84_1655, partial [Nocardioides sp.]|nr:hypothetical protein [Nocardioides sp.]